MLAINDISYGLVALVTSELSRALIDIISSDDLSYVKIIQRITLDIIIHP